MLSLPTSKNALLALPAVLPNESHMPFTECAVTHNRPGEKSGIRGIVHTQSISFGGNFSTKSKWALWLVLCMSPHSLVLVNLAQEFAQGSQAI